MENEKLKILEMIEKGIISSSEGMKLLETMEPEKERFPIEIDSKQSKWLRIRIIDSNSRIKAKINIPISIVKIALGLGAKYSKELNGIEGIDPDEIIDLIQNGAEGKIVDLEQEDGSRVEVTVE